MCDPASIIGGVMSVAAGAIQASAQSSFVDAQNKANKEAYDMAKKARETELGRQKEYEAQAAGYWDKTRDQLTVESHDKQRAEAVQDFEDKYSEMPATMKDGQLLSGQEYASADTKKTIATEANKAATATRERVNALARMSSYGTTDVARGAALNDSANAIQTTNGLRRGSLSVSGQEQNIAPAQVTQGSTMFADVLSGMGGLVSSGGLGALGGKTTTIKNPTYSPRASAAIKAGGVTGTY